MLKKKKLKAGRFQVIPKNGVDIVALDFSNSTYAEAWALLEYFDSWISGQSGHSVLLRVDLDHYWYDPAWVTYCRRSLVRYDAALKKVALVHATPFDRLLALMTLQFLSLTGGTISKSAYKAFESIDDGTEWLLRP